MERVEGIDNIKVNRNIGDIVEYVSNMFNNAITAGASDIHIEPTENFVLIRIRKDGDFLIVDKVHLDHKSAIITRLKVLAKVKIDENKKPQDGKIVYKYEETGENIDVRFSTLPTKYGEKIVMRILRQDSSLTNLNSLGLIDVNVNMIQEVLKSKYGIILIAGPTGSGKTTTLFGILKSFNPLESNISTLEDPIEYTIKYVNQSQVKPEIGYSFANGLRTMLRQDPDIIMVGEIRDKETAILAVEAALTGHLVFSTIHTNSAAGTVQRLLNMGVEPFLLSSAIKMVISQRLGKRICKNCKKEEKISEIKLKKIKDILGPIIDKETSNNLKFYKGNGCEACSFTGYSGRLGFHEVLVAGDYLEPLILNTEPASMVRNAAIENGMITILQDALLKALIGKTTIDEAFKLI